VRSRYKRQPNRKLLLSGTAIRQKENFVWEVPGVDLSQQFTGVWRRRITRDEDLFCWSEPEIESGRQGRNRFGA